MLACRAMRTRLRRFVGLVSFGTAFAVTSCGSSDAARQPHHEGSVGSAGLELTVAPGIALDSFTYTITGPGGFTRTQTVDVSHSSTLSVLVSSLPIGSGFTVTIDATSTDGGTTCAGSAGFSVSASSTTAVVVRLQCHEAPHKGSVRINGQLNLCAAVDGIEASPGEALIGGAIQLSAASHDTDGGPSPVSYQWTASSGALANGTSASPTLTCTTAGPVTVTVTVTDGDCGDSVTSTVDCTAPADPVSTVAATIETTPVPDTGDAADDPAVWVHPSDPSLSVIIGTDKQAGGGLGVYGLDGHEIQYVPFGKLNNVDLRDGFPLSGAPVTLVTAGNRTDNTIAIFRLDPVTRQLTDVAARRIGTLVTYGSCMYKSPVSGKYYYFVDAKDGNIEQWELFESAGKVDATKVRDLHKLASQPEACAVDDVTKKFYIGEEAKGVWEYDAEPDVTSGPGFDGVLIASTDPGGHLVRDVEGVAISKTSPTTGYIYVSNQGASTYSVFTLEAPHAYVKTFRVARSAACIDAVTGSDGIEVNAANLGPAFPHGVFVTQDDSNDGANQNFKLVPLDEILGTAPPIDDSACGGGAPDGGSGTGTGGTSGAGGAGGSTGYGAAFCDAFCAKCASCYATGTFSEGDCVFQHPKTDFTVEDCSAGCAVSATPGAAAKASIGDVGAFESLSCDAFDAAM